MADEFNSTGTWWDSGRPTTNTAARFDVVGSNSSSSSALGSFGWPSEMVSDVKPRTSIDSVSVSGSSVHDSSTDLHMMGLGLSSQPIDWNQTLLSRSDHNKGAGESGFRSMLHESMSPSSSYATQESAWRAAENAVPESPVTASSFHIDSAAALYGNPSTLLQGILGSSDNNHPSSAPSSNRGLNFQQFANYGSVINPSELMQPASSWNSSNSSGNNSKVPPFLRGSPPKQMLFSNNAPFWNPAATAVSADVRPSFFSSPSQQPQFPASAPSFDEKPKNISEAGDSASSVGKKSGSDAAASKRPRNETTSSTLPAFKVRKEKMGDRITALQQLVSPFGKTDTASVLSEAIEYIKFLHDQVNVLSTPYMKSGASIQQQQQQNLDKSNESDHHQGPKQDLRSRGLCLVPVSSTFPVTHETTVDYWTPTFGGTFR